MKLNYRTFLAAVGVALSMAVLMGTPPVLEAQQAAGSITGVVMDPSGAPIANATVTVREVDRGTVWTAKTTAAGVYDFPTVPVGNVEVKAEANGFSIEVRKAFALSVDQVATVDFKLQVGSVTETVTVNDAPPLLQTASTEVGTLIDASAASQLPLATRDINQLTLLAPGVLSSNIFAFQSPQTTFGTGRPYVNGAREQDNNFILDGMDINQPDNDEVSYTPCSRRGPGIQHHRQQRAGRLRQLCRRRDCGIDKVRNQPVPRRPLRVRPQHRSRSQHLAGQGHGLYHRLRHGRPSSRAPSCSGTSSAAQVGGPIIKNKLFFFADEETSIYNQPKTAQPEHAGSQRQLLHATAGKLGSQVYDLGYVLHRQRRHIQRCGSLRGKGSQLYMPATGVAAGARAAIPYNQIPVSAVDPVAKALVALPAFQKQVSTLNYFSSGYTHNFQGDVKIDWQASDNDHVMGRYTQMYTHLISEQRRQTC